MPSQDPLFRQIIGLFYRILNTLGYRFAEKVNGKSPGKRTGDMELKVMGTQ